MELSGTEYKAIVEASPNMIWRSGLDANCDYFNTTWLRFTGRTMEQEVGAGWLSGVHADDMDECMRIYLESFEKREAFEMEYRLKRFDGQWRWINDRGVPVFDAKGSFTGYIGSCVDVTEKIEGRKLTQMAHYDKLTGVFNRNYLDILMEYEAQRIQQEQYSTALLMIDIDCFKYFNDEYGHDFGDKVLAEVARAISRKLRESDYIGRFGGDEFLVILPKTSIADACAISRRILESAGSINVERSYETIGLSIGISELKQGVSPIDAWKRADMEMFKAKNNGGNQFSF